MKSGRVDILLPTKGERLNGLIFQVNAILNQSYKNRVLWVLVDGDDEIFDLIKRTIAEQCKGAVEVIHVPNGWRGNWGHRPIKWALENLPLEGEWVITSGDDDCIMEWALDELVKNSEGVDTVIGICIPTKRNYSFVKFYLGENIQLANITGSCCLYRRSRVMEVGYDDSRYEADWDLIEKMLKFPYCKINSVLFVMPQSF